MTAKSLSLQVLVHTRLVGAEIFEDGESGLDRSFSHKFGHDILFGLESVGVLGEPFVFFVVLRVVLVALVNTFGSLEGLILRTSLSFLVVTQSVGAMKAVGEGIVLAVLFI